MFRQLSYLIIWVIALLLYEFVALLPEPWGYFHYGWWKLKYSAVLNPFLLLIMLFFYKWTFKIEKKALENKNT